MSSAAAPSRPTPASWLPIAVPALAWGAQGLLGWYVMAHACAEAGPGATGLTPGSARIVVGVFTILAIAASAVSMASAARRRQYREALGSDEELERNAYLSTAGVLVAASLTLGMVFAGLSTLFIAFCGVTR